MCIESPRYPGKKTAETKGQKFIACRVDTGCPDSQFILPDGMENNASIGVGDLPHNRAQAEHHHDCDVVISDARLGQPSKPRNPQFSTREVRKGKDEAHQDDGEGKGGQGQIRTSESEAGYPYDKACQNCTQRTKGDGAPWRDTRIFIEQSCTIGSHSKEEGVPEIHLTGETGKQIPARSQYGKDTGQSKDAQEVSIFGKQR